MMAKLTGKINARARRFQQKLGEISPEDGKKEGFNSLEEFRKA